MSTPEGGAHGRGGAPGTEPGSGHAGVTEEVLLRRALHHLRTPLSVAVLQLNGIADGAARSVEREIASVCNCLTRLGDYARLRSLTTIDAEPVDLRAITDAVVRDVEPQARQRDVRISVRALPQRAAVVSPALITQAMTELVDNAVRYARSGGQCTVTGGPGICLTVDDDGPGLPDQDVSFWLEPFAHEPSSERAGLGLAIVAEVVRLHRGTLSLERSPLGGCRAVLAIPASAGGDA